MSQPDNRSTAKALPGSLARPDWRPDGELTASELGLEQRYFIQRLRRHLRLAHGWGVVCGLRVAAAGGWNLYVCPGYASVLAATKFSSSALSASACATTFGRSRPASPPTELGSRLKLPPIPWRTNPRPRSSAVAAAATIR